MATFNTHISKVKAIRCFTSAMLFLAMIIAITLVSTRDANAYFWSQPMNYLSLNIADIVPEKDNAARTSRSRVNQTAQRFEAVLNDPLTRSREAHQGRDLLHAPLQQSTNVSENSLSQNIDKLKNKALSLLAALGEFEDEKTYSIRKPINKTVVSLPEKPAPAPMSKPLPRIEEEAMEPANVMRMPVQKVYKRSLVIDMEAETKARKLLTQEAKASLLPVTGELSAVFESGKEGIAAVGYDRYGGTSYGKYQIASRVGTMKLFLNFLKDEEPKWAARLSKSGPMNTRSRWGGMPSEWKKIAAESPKRFEELQDKFILQTNYQPALDKVKARTNINVAELSPAVQEVLWSTAVQHGPSGASKIFTRAMQKAAKAKSQDFDKNLIEEIYQARKRGFSRHSRRIRTAVTSRLNREKFMALNLLDQDLNKPSL